MLRKFYGIDDSTYRIVPIIRQGTLVYLLPLSFRAMKVIVDMVNLDKCFISELNLQLLDYELRGVQN